MLKERQTTLGAAFVTIVLRDLALAFRNLRETLNPLFFFIMVLTLFPLGVSPESRLLQLIAPGVVWVGALLATLLSIDSLFKQDFEDGSLDVLMVSRHPLFVIVMAKVLAYWLITGLPLTLVAPLLGGMLHLNGSAMMAVFVTLLLGTPTMCLISAIAAALTVGFRKGGLLVALMILPLYMPLLIFASSAIEMAGVGEPVNGQLAILGAMLALALCLAPFAVSAGLRISING